MGQQRGTGRVHDSAVWPLLFACLALAGPGSTARGEFRAGFAERDVTPEIGMEQPGGYGKAFHRSLHDPCKVRAAVFSDGAQSVAVVSVDALLVHREQVLAARERITDQCGLPGEAVLIHATHSHSSGPTGMVLPGQYNHASALVRALAYERSSMADAAFLKRLVEQIVDAVVAAHNSLSPATGSTGFGYEDQVAFNRRFRMRSGLTQTHPRPGNPDIVEPAGPIDPQVGVLGCWNEQGRLTGCLVNYACHATTSPGGISANYISTVEQVIRGVFGEQVIVVYLAGASGDVTQVDNLAQAAPPAAVASMRLVGGSIGAEAVKVLLRAVPGELTPVRSAQRLLEVPRRIPRPERLESARRIVGEPPFPQSVNTEWVFAKELLMLEALLAVAPVVEAEVQAIQIGPVVLLSDPAEFFCELGLQIKAGSAFPVTLPVSLANGCVGYVPTREAFGPRGGGYETRLTSYSNLSIDAGDRFVEAALQLAADLTPGEIPQRGPAAPFRGGPWDYGALPPEVD